MKTKRNRIQICLLCVLMLQALTTGAQPVTQITAGYGHSLFLKSNGSLWAMGLNGNGQLGDGTSGVLNQSDSPEQIVTSNVTAIAAGDYHSLFLTSDGSLWATGLNGNGQLGDSTYTQTNRPELIVSNGVTAVAAGEYHTLFLKTDGSLWATGDNQFGELGDGTCGTHPTYGTNQPEKVVASNVTVVAAGGFHTLFLKSDGSLWAMGDNYFGELGDGTRSNTNHPEMIVASNVTAIAAGDYHSLFLKNDGSLWAMGYNSDGQLGVNTGNGIYVTNRPDEVVTSNVIAIAAGQYQSLFLRSDGSLWVMGNNGQGQLGDGTDNDDINPPEQILTSDAAAIAAGAGHSLLLKKDASLWGMGWNLYGQLSDGLPSNTNRPAQILGPYNQIQTTGQLFGGTNMQLSFVGIAGTNYALDRASSLSPPNWIPQATNPAGSFGALVFTNAPDATTNNFWRIRSVP